MAKMKPKTLFGEKYQEILERASVRSVLESYGLSVNKNKTICPFHTDHDPSLSITKDEYGIALSAVKKEMRLHSSKNMKKRCLGTQSLKPWMQ